MSYSLSIFAECSDKIGTGHLIESLNILKTALDRQIKSYLWVSDTVPVNILKAFSCQCRNFGSFNTKKETERIQKGLIREGCKVVVFNFRRISNKILEIFRAKDFKLICIDEPGNRKLDCDVIINPSIVNKYHNYFLEHNNRQRIYKGPRFLSMSGEFARLHQQKRIFNKEVKVVSICMGGIDRTGTTLKIIDSLAGWRKDIKKNIILGGGFLYIDEVRKKIKGLKGKNFRIYHNLPGIAGLLLESDFIFTAGGNTLYESACAGTPPIVLYEDEHEKENGLMFERHGFGYCLGKGLDITKSDILDAVKRFEDIKARQAHSSKGKGLVDGKGSYRILDIIERLV